MVNINSSDRANTMYNSIKTNKIIINKSESAGHMQPIDAFFSGQDSSWYTVCEHGWYMVGVGSSS